MDELSLTRSTVEDLQGVGSLFLRRQCSIGILRINFERAATRLRILAPDAAETVREYIGQMDEIQAKPSKEQYVAVGSMLDRFGRWARDPKPPVPVAPVVVPEPEPVVAAPPPPPPQEFLALPTPGSVDAVPPPPPDIDDIPTDPLDAPRRVL